MFSNDLELSRPDQHHIVRLLPFPQDSDSFVRVGDWLQLKRKLLGKFPWEVLKVGNLPQKVKPFFLCFLLLLHQQRLVLVTVNSQAVAGLRADYSRCSLIIAHQCKFAEVAAFRHSGYLNVRYQL